MGSMHEVGFYEGCVKEDTPTNPQSMYGISKNALRQSINVLQKEYLFEFLWLRGFYIVGNNKYGCSVFSKLETAVEKGEKIFHSQQVRINMILLIMKYFVIKWQQRFANIKLMGL